METEYGKYLLKQIKKILKKIRKVITKVITFFVQLLRVRRIRILQIR